MFDFIYIRYCVYMVHFSPFPTCWDQGQGTPQCTGPTCCHHTYTHCHYHHRSSCTPSCLPPTTHCRQFCACHPPATPPPALPFHHHFYLHSATYSTYALPPPAVPGFAFACLYHLLGIFAVSATCHHTLFVIFPHTVTCLYCKTPLGHHTHLGWTLHTLHIFFMPAYYTHHFVCSYTHLPFYLCYLLLSSLVPAIIHAPMHLGWLATCALFCVLVIIPIVTYTMCKFPTFGFFYLSLLSCLSSYLLFLSLSPNNDQINLSLPPSASPLLGLPLLLSDHAHTAIFTCPSTTTYLPTTTFYPFHHLLFLTIMYFCLLPYIVLTLFCLCCLLHFVLFTLHISIWHSFVNFVYFATLHATLLHIYMCFYLIFCEAW